MGIANIITLFGGIALFLFGMFEMGNGLKKVAGTKLELILYRLSSTPLRGVLLGTGVTGIIQSSSATSVMVVGFVNSKMMNVRQAIGVILGSILGTSVTGWIICLSDIGGNSDWIELFSSATLTGFIASVGIILRMFCKNATKRHVGDILLGFSIIMYGMQQISSSVSSIKDSDMFIKMLTMFENPVLGILIGIVITAIIQSSSAAVGMLQALSVSGEISFSMAFPLILGIAIGASVPVLISAIGASVNGKRTALEYLIINAVGVVIIAPIFYLANFILKFNFMNVQMTMVSIATLNSAFRLATLIILMPLIGFLVKLACFIVPDRNGNGSEKTDGIDTLEERFIEHPTLAIEQSRKAICEMAEKAELNFKSSLELLHKYSDELYQDIQLREDIVDRYEDKLGSYIVKLTGKELSHNQSKEVSKFLHTISDVERISDHAVNIADVAREMYEKKLVFSFEAEREINILVSAVTEIVNICVNLFTKGDIDFAYRVEPLEEMIDGLCDELKLHHVARISSGNCSLAQGFVFNDLITNLERTADHCSNIAVAVIELESDSFDTHEYLSSLKAMKTSAFERYYNEYKEKYSLNKIVN
ncbi:MAG: Na/Pi cotransporter family protein [Clostridiales bacterium]|nr:Na/Pi cotransporter family protein [Clostridiales bacterium]